MLRQKSFHTIPNSSKPNFLSQSNSRFTSNRSLHIPNFNRNSNISIKKNRNIFSNQSKQLRITKRLNSSSSPERTLDSISRSEVYDAVIIGGGHNGLVSAAYLAKAGKNVAVLERRHVVGGAAVTEEIVPGFKFSRASYLCSLFRRSIVEDLDLEQHGFELIPRDPASFTPLLDGRYLMMGAQEDFNVKQISKFSSRDAEAFPQYEAYLTRLAEAVEPMLDQSPLDSSSIHSLSDVWNQVGTLIRNAQRFIKSPELLPQIYQVMTAPASKIINKWFESEPLKATLATDAVIGAMAAPSTPGSGYVLFHHVMGDTGGARGVWAYVKGGMGALSESIASAAESHGAKIATSASVSHVRINDQGSANGVVLEDGTEIQAKSVLSNADPHTTFTKLVAQEHLPEQFVREVDNIDFSSPVVKINVALDSLPNFTARPNPSDGSPGPQHRGTIHFLEHSHDIEEAYRDCLLGDPSARPVIEMTIPSAVDPTLAPPGKHVAQLFVQYVPYHLKEGSWNDTWRRDMFADRVFDVIEDYAPGFKQSVIERDVLTPIDLERVFGLHQGNIFHGSMGLDQLYFMRPVKGYSRYASPVPGLYLCGAGAHPGGGVSGAPGRNAANVVLKNL
eukprot:gb/GECH01001498.1/.p1 GENE.gb/GECH01001498.1/~~gb/GECH01001498.1/.p1  ORF type:complete len:618 (+),score=130.80 gb/GECH01001498.1/:1-1854(+)